MPRYERIKRHTVLRVLGYVLFFALLCVLIPVLEGWVAILLLRLEFKSEDIAWFIVLNVVAVALLLAIILVRSLMSKKTTWSRSDTRETQQEIK
jgi:hypothetical protein